MSTLSGLPAPVLLGTAEPINDSLAVKLNKVYEVGGKLYMLVKATSAIATAAGRGLSIKFTAGAPNGFVDLPAAPASDFLVAVPTGQVGSTGGTGLVANDVFLAQIWGFHSGLLAADTVAVLTANVGLFANSLGQWVAGTAAYLGGGCRFTNTAAPASVSAATTGFISTVI